MEKFKYVLIIVVLVAMFSFVIFMNYDKISNYFNSKGWEIANSIANIHFEKYIKTGSAGDKIVIVESDQINGYTNSSESQFKIDTNLKDVVIDSTKDFLVIGEKYVGKLMLLNDKGKVWEKNISGDILSVSVNKNGYVACVYSKSGYKCLIKVINPSGEELFTNYLASTYAVDVEISNDNKYMAIAEVNTEGISLESNIKIIDMNNANENKSINIELDDNSLILDIEYNDKNEIMVLEDNKIELVNNDLEKKLIVEYNHNNATKVSIENNNNAVIIEKNDTGIFSSEYIIRIYSSAKDFKEQALEMPVDVLRAQGKIICINSGNHIMFFNTNGKLVKRCRIEGQVRDIELYNNGNMAGIIFKDKIEIIKL